jgi:hypothetical protein
MDRHRGTRRMTALVALSAAIAISAIAPSLASGQNVVGDLLQGLGLGDQGGAPAAGVPGGSGYQPPAHGSNPHGQGTVGTVDILPSNTLPLSEDPAGGEGDDQEEVVIGRSRGEQNPDGSYHGHITIFALFGSEFVGVDTDPGETESGPFDPLQQDVLNEICAGSGGQLCLIVLKADSSTTNSGSTNSFNAVNLNLGGEEGLHVSLLESNGNIEGDSSCQTSHGDSKVIDVNAGERQPIITLGESSADSQACNNGPSSQQNDSRFLVLGGNEVAEDCASGEEFEFTDFFPLFAFVCNADDTNGVGEPVNQMGEPYGVREALTVFLGLFVPNGDTVALALAPPEEETAFLKGTAAASESHAVAPRAPTPPVTPVTPGVVPGAGGQAGQQAGGPEGQAEAGEGPGGPVSTEAGPGPVTRDLAFTGTDVLVLGLIGAGLVMAGLTAMRLAVRHRLRHRRATV